MGFLSKWRSKLKRGYRKVDTRLGGRLPGGVPVSKKEDKKEKTVSKPSAFVGPVRPKTVSRPSTSRVSKPSAPSRTTTPSKPSAFVGPVRPKTVSRPSTSKPSAPSKAPQKQQSTVSAYQRPKGGFISEKLKLGSIGGKIASRSDILRTQKLRSKTGNIKAIREAELIGLGFSRAIIGGVGGLLDLPETAYNIAKNPRVLKDLPKIIKTGGKEFGAVLRTSPGEALGRVGGEIVFMKGSVSALNKVGQVSKAQLTKLNPKYVGKAKVGTELKINTGAGKSVKLKVVGKIPKEAIKSQIKKAGKKLSAISSQADELLGIIRRKRLIRKPIPGEEKFNQATKKLLEQFDKGKISKTNLLKLNEAIKKQGAKGLLERAFFADPTGKIRPSRLGVVKDKSPSLLDYFTEDIVLKKAKPQILLFENIKVQAFPKALKTVGNKLKKGIALTKAEADRLLKFQLKKSGKFKPVGFISGESEITLAPGEILKRAKKVGVTIVNGKRVPIVKAEVFKPTGKIKSLINKFEAGKLTKAQTKQLDKMLTKATGFKYGLSSAKKIAGKYIDIKKITAAGLSKILPKKRKLESMSIKTQRAKKIKGIKSIGPKIAGKPKAPAKPSLPKAKISKPKKRSGRKAPSKPKTPAKPSKSKKPVKKKRARTPPYSGKYTPRRPSKKPALSIRRRSYTPRKPSPTKSPKRIKRPVSPKSSKRPVSPKKPKYPYSPKKGKKAPPKPVKRVKADKKKKKKEKEVKPEGYYVYEKRAKGKYVKINGLPLSQKDAKDKLAHRLDNKISRTAKLVPVRKVKKLGKLPPKQKGYFKKYKKNLRNYKIVKGKKVKTPNTFIEKKGSGVISTPGEKRQLALNRRAKAKKPVGKQIKRTTRPRTVKRTVIKTTRPRTVKRTVRKPTKRKTAKPKTVKRLTSRKKKR